MTIKEMYEEAVKNGWENLQVKVLQPSSTDYYGNRIAPSVMDGSLVHRDKDFWQGVDEEFLAII